MAVTAQMVKELRGRTGAGIKECRDVLEQTGGDINKAIELLRERGIEAAAKKMDREAREGRVDVYIHPGERLAAIIELNCETDFVARTEGFIQLTRDLALHIAAMNPRYINKEDVPEEVITESGQSADKFYEEQVLMMQTYVKDPSVTIEDKIREAIGRIGENIVVRRFVRYEIGE